MSTNTRNFKRIYRGFNAVQPVINWILTIGLAIGMYALTTRDFYRDGQKAHAQQINELQREVKTNRDYVDALKKERDRQIEGLLTKEVFQATMEGIQREQTRQSNLLERILQNQGK